MSDDAAAAIAVAGGAVLPNIVWMFCHKLLSRVVVRI